MDNELELAPTAANEPQLNWQQQLEAAEELFAGGAITDAEAAYHRIVDAEPLNPDAYIGTAKCARRRGDHAAALSHFLAAARLAPAHPLLPLEAANELRELKRVDEADAFCRTVLEKNPDIMQAHMGLGLGARMRADHTDALSFFQAAVRLAPNDVWAQQEVLAELWTLGRPDEAEAFCAGIIEAVPDHLHARLVLGGAARRRGDHVAALDYYQAAARLAPEEFCLQLEVASELQALDRLEEADAICYAVLNKTPHVMQAYMWLGLGARKRSDHAGALSFFQTAAQMAPEDIWPRQELLTELQALGRADEAEAACREIIKIAPDHLHAQLILGTASRRRGDHDAALGHFQAAAQLAPGETNLALEAAASLRDLSRLDEADAACADVLARHPDVWPAHMGLGLTARVRGDFNAALRHFQAAEQGAPADFWPKMAMAATLRDLGRLDEAEAIYRRILKIAPENIEAHMGLGFCARRRGDQLTAISHYRAAAQLAPADFWPKMEIGAELRELGRLDEADAIYHAVLADMPDNVQVLLSLAQTARLRGDRAAALLHLETAARMAPDDSFIQLEIATEQRDAGDLDAARNTVLAVLARRPMDLPAMVSLGHTERAAGRHEAALAAFEAAYAAAPQQAWILIELAMAEQQLGHRDKCDQFLNQALALEPRNVMAITRRADQAMMANEFEKAYADYQRAAAEQPWELNFQLGKLEALARMGHMAEAISGLQQLEEARGPLTILRVRRCSLLRQTGQYHAALQLARETTLTDTHSFWLWVERFHAEIFVGDAAHVEDCLRGMNAATVEQNALLERFKGNWAESRWQIDEAIHHYEIASEMSPRDPIIQDLLVQTKLLRMDFAGALVNLRRACEVYIQGMRSQGRTLNISQTKFGQLYNEYVLDRELGAVLTQLQDLPPAARASELAGVVRENPDSTAAAVSLMVALRESGALQHRVPAGGGVIPRRIVQFWDSEAIPADIAEIMQSWAAQNPDYEIECFNSGQAQSWLTQHFHPDVALAYRRSREPAQKADIFRLAWLVTNGGIYADTDDRCLRPLDSFLPANAELVTYQEVLGTVGNNFIAVVPGHPVLSLALQLAVIAVNRGDNDGVWYTTGPALLTRAFAQVLAADGITPRAGIVVLDQRELFQAVAIGCAAAYKNTDRHWSNAALANRRKAALSA